MPGTAKTKSKTKAPIKEVESSRRIEAPKYQSFRLSKKIRQHNKQLPKARVIFVESLSHLWKFRSSFAGIVAVYLALTVLLVKGLSIGSDIPEIKTTLQDAFIGASGQVAMGIALFGLLIGGSTGAATDIAGTYQSILLVLVSLALIWTLRQTHAGKKIGTREAFYRGMYPLVPFLGVLAVIALQLLPLFVASWLFNTTITLGLAVTPPEQILWILLCLLLTMLSIYLVSSSVFALYVSTLPDMTPLKALRSTRDLVRYRRWEIMRKVLFLPVMLLIIGALIVVPVILFVTPLAELLFFILSMAVLAVSHSYMYSLYRELL